MVVGVVGTTTLLWGEVVMQSPGHYVEIVCGILIGLAFMFWSA